MAAPVVRSLDIVAEEVRTERGLQLSHFDSLDSKAGIVLGFAGAIVALAPGGRHLLVELGRAAAVISALLALWSFWPRRYWHVDLRSLRDLYLTAEPGFARLRLLDTQIGMAEGMKATLASKASRLKSSMAALALAATLTAAGLAVD
ncbi:MAG: hypothetical protein AB1551_08700 [Actinomycetota bacterium]